MRFVAMVIVCGCALSLEGWLAAQNKTPASSRGPLSVQEALRSFQLPDDCAIELFAAEPHVQDPVAMAFDENGRVFVVEMGDYPLGKNGGKIKVLEDRDGDGRVDHSSVFAESLSFPNGVQPWKNGILVSAAPDLLFLKDTDGDGKADVRETVLTGFAQANPQHRFNSPTFCIDSWIYCADGMSKTGIHVGPKSSGKPIQLRGSDFRFQQTDGASTHFELVSGHGQYGIAFDDWGRRFINNNSIHIRYPVLPWNYLQRNPYLAVKEVIDEIAEEGYAAPVFPISKIESRFNDPEAAGHFTSACSPMIFNSDQLPESYRGNVFVCEPVHNLVHRCKLTPNGVSFKARRADERREFLSSSDNWFRPVSTTVGPDGALYVIDMYRAVIEHPQWIPLDIQKKIDLRAGHERGRIYRIVPKAGLRRVTVELGKSSTRELVEQLENSQAWWRLTAERLLVERRDKAAVAPLQKLAKESKTAVGKAHALWTLHALASVDDGLIERALGNASPELRILALRLADTRLNETQSLRKAVIARADDEDKRVRFQAAFTLGAVSDSAGVAALANIAARDMGDKWVRTAILSSTRDTSADLLAELQLKNRDVLEKPRPGALEFAREVAAVIGARHDPDELKKSLLLVTHDDNVEPRNWQLAFLAGLGDSLGRSGVALRKSLPSPSVESRLQEWTKQASAIAGAPSRGVSERVDALALVGHFATVDLVSPLRRLLQPDVPVAVQTATVRAMAEATGDEVTVNMLGEWNVLSPQVRRELLSILLSRPARARLMLDALEKDVIRKAEIDAPRREQLARYPDRSIRERSARIFADVPASNRHQLVSEWSSKVLSLTPDATRGQKIYATQCANCHRLHGQGLAVGPDLAGVSSRTREALIVDILDPNRAVDPTYVDYVVVTHNGNIANGLIASESASSITLRRAERQETTVLRKDVAELRSTSISLMPEGMEKNMTPQELADLIELLRQRPLH